MARKKYPIKYKVVGGKHFMKVDGVMTAFKPGETIELDPNEVPPGLKDRLIPVVDVSPEPEPEPEPDPEPDSKPAKPKPKPE